MLGKSFPSAGFPRPELGGPCRTIPTGALPHLMFWGCLYLTTAVSCAVALGRSYLPYRPFALKSRTAMKTRETRRRLPKTIQGMRSVSSRDSLSFTLTGTEDSGNPIQAEKEMDVGPFNTFLCLFNLHEVSPPSFSPVSSSSLLFKSSHRASKCLIYGNCSVSAY